MRQSIELYFLINLAMDVAVLTIVARANDCLDAKRVLIAGLAAAFYALAVRILPGRPDHPAVQLALLAPIGILLTGDTDPQIWAPVVFQLLCACLIVGGIGALAAQGSPLQPGQLSVVLGAGLLLTCLLMRFRARRLTTWEVTVFLSLAGKTARFRALIDTGNRLREPISGQPVLIAESSLLREVLDGAAPAYRSVSFGALGGSGVIRCFKPDAVLIRRENRLLQAPSVWVAVYPGKIPGSTHALAPPSFAVIPGKP